MDLDKSTSTNASLKKLQDDGALPGRGTMERETGGTEPEPVLSRMVAVEDYILCSFLPPPSEFLLLVLNFYGLSLLHLNPNSIAFLSIFSCLCEAYIGVEPFVDLFRFYYELRWMEPKKVSGCVGFRLQDGLKSRFIPFQCPSSRSKWRARWFYLQIENSDPVFVVPEEQPDKISEWTAKPALTPSFQSFIDIIDDLRIRGLSGYEVATDFISRRIQPLQARAHPAFDYSGPEDTTWVSHRGLNSETVECCVSQVMISGPTTASNAPVPLCEKGTAEREAAINALPLTDVIGPLADHQTATSLKEGVAKEASDIAAAAATTSGSNVPKKGRKFSSVLGNRRKAETVGKRLLRRAARAKAAQDGSGATSSVSPMAASTDVVVTTRDREATPSGPAGDLVPARGPPVDALTWRELQAEMERILQGLEHRMSEFENNLPEIRGSLRVSYTTLHQLAGECGVTTTIPATLDEFSLTSSLVELVVAMDEIPSKHAARIGEDTSNGIYTGACHVLACVRLAYPDLDLQRILDQGAANDARKDMMGEVDDLGESILHLFEE
uniref:Heavy chain myosin n=1 Tax=Oryza sativa subsp. japonica TaxID=39947 RepID=Q5WMT4_ORYSJ|nr:putative heavy chain myosin [Oryza sativa Japonica Group]